jgi:membrane-associated PAP2 superfamily phosphatase
MKKAKIIFFTFSFLFILLFSFGVNRSLADATSSESGSGLWTSQLGMDKVGSAYGEDQNPIDIRYRVVKIINIVVSIIGILLVILMVYAGFLWMTASGNEDQISKAKKIMANAAVGLVIVFLSWSITYFILKRLTAINVGDPNYVHPTRYDF